MMVARSVLVLTALPVLAALLIVAALLIPAALLVPAVAAAEDEPESNAPPAVSTCDATARRQLRFGSRVVGQFGLASIHRFSERDRGVSFGGTFGFNVEACMCSIGTRFRSFFGASFDLVSTDAFAGGLAALRVSFEDAAPPPISRFEFGWRSTVRLGGLLMEDRRAERDSRAAAGFVLGLGWRAGWRSSISDHGEVWISFGLDPDLLVLFRDGRPFTALLIRYYALAFEGRW